MTRHLRAEAGAGAPAEAADAAIDGALGAVGVRGAPADPVITADRGVGYAGARLAHTAPGGLITAWILSGCAIGVIDAEELTIVIATRRAGLRAGLDGPTIGKGAELNLFLLERRAVDVLSGYEGADARAAVLDARLSARRSALAVFESLA